MQFLYPLGLLGLIGVPILIIIYIIKSKYTEQTIASTYLWTLSERFLKRKKPISKLTGVISLILQILVVILASFAIANPVFTLSNVADEYCFILDASGSMNITQDGVSRFEKGKDKVGEIIGGSVKGSLYTVIYVGENTSVLCEKSTDKERTLLMLEETACSQMTAEISDAIALAQGYFNENPSVEVYLITDKAYQNCENIHLLNFSNGEQNYAVSDVSYEIVKKADETEELQVSADVVSYESDATLSLEMKLDDTVNTVLRDSVDVLKGERKTVKFIHPLTGTTDFTKVTVSITDRDAMSLDNEIVRYDLEKANEYNVLIVDDDGQSTFLEGIVSSIPGANVETVASLNYTGEGAYGLYIFDSFIPQELPQNGAIWLINIQESVGSAGLTFISTYEDKDGEMTLAPLNSTLAKTLTQNLTGKALPLCKYIKYGQSKKFTVLYEYQNDPVIFTGMNDFGNREVVFAFDFKDSDFVLQYDYIALIKNLLEYSFPAALSDVSYQCGEEAMVNIIPNCKSIRVDSPSGKISYLSVSDATSSFALTEVGVYTITLMLGDQPKEYYIYSSMVEEESKPIVAVGEISLQGVASEENIDGIYDDLLIFFICLAVLFLAEWVVYSYDKYQLR